MTSLSIADHQIARMARIYLSGGHKTSLAWKTRVIMLQHKAMMWKKEILGFN